MGISFRHLWGLQCRLPPMRQFSICLDDDVFEGLRDMAKVARRHYREQAATLVDRAVKEWLRSGRMPSAAVLDPNDEPVAA
jgi:hypothetical protein